MVKIIVAHHRVRRSSNKPFLNQEVTSTQTKYSISTIPSSFDLLVSNKIAKIIFDEIFF